MSIVGDKTNNQNAPNGPGGDLRVFRCLSTGCVDPDVHAECPCASCFDGHGNCLGWVNVENMAPTNINKLDLAIKAETVTEFFKTNPEVWNELFPKAPREALIDLQKGYTTLKMYKIEGGTKHLYTIIDAVTKEATNY